MEGVVDYIILYGENGAIMTEKVKQFIAKGFILYGSPYAIPREGGINHCQAMVLLGKANPQQ